MPAKKFPQTAQHVTCDCCDDETKQHSWLGAGVMVLVVVGLYLLLKPLGIFSLASTAKGAVGLSGVFVIGLLAATSSCLAIVGGLLLSVSAKWCETFHPKTHAEKLRPLLLFNAGRLAGYALLGGVAGFIGQSLALSPRAAGIVSLGVAGVMIVIGLNLLHILPKRYCRMPLPRGLSTRIRNLSQSRSFGAPLLLGALTFFLPCGFTQSMQLLALSSGSFVAGALIMFVFALGTLPSLLGISLVSSFVEGKTARLFLRFSGAMVLLLGIVNLQSGLLLTGNDPLHFLTVWGREQTPAGNDPYVTIDPQGRQIMSMYVTSTGYTPGNFTIRSGLETWVYAIAKEPVSGCASYLVDATHNLQTPIRQGGNWLGPIAKAELKKDFVLTCSMGMFRANVHVM